MTEKTCPELTAVFRNNPTALHCKPREFNNTMFMLIYIEYIQIKTMTNYDSKLR